MNIAWIKFGLKEIKRNFDPILDDNADWVIQDAIAQLDSTKKDFDWRRQKTHDPKLVPEPWGYCIDPDSPLCFEPRAINGMNVWADLYCTILWKEEGALPVEQCIHLRVWSDEIDRIYREDWDSEHVYNNLTDEGRVMFRCHFDLADPGGPGPEYHLQFGGNPRVNELCWLPEFMKLPRLPYPPMDLVLICQLIAVNFYWDEYIEFRETAEWISALRNSQQYLLKDYYEGCLDALDRDLLVDHLWNPTCVEG
jgi:hypothetical protein